jgi:cytochrome c553
MSTPIAFSYAGFVCAGLLFCGCALADPPPPAHVRSLAATCAACHGTDGRAVRGSAIPSLAGLSRDYFVARMRDYRDGTLPSSIMQQIAKGFSDEQTNLLGAYFAARR